MAFGLRKSVLHLSRFLPCGFESHTIQVPIIKESVWSPGGQALKDFQPSGIPLGLSAKLPGCNALLPFAPSGFAGLQEGDPGRSQVGGQHSQNCGWYSGGQVRGKVP